jgi:outer membrane protein OmpA-like peptidoglycan-associated protein
MTFDRTHNFVGASYGFDKFALGFGWINAGTDDLSSTGLDGQLGDTFSFNENAMLLSAALGAGPANLGVTGKMLIQDVGTEVISSGEENVTGFGIDVGAQFAVTEHARLGLNVHDLFTNAGGQEQADVDKVPATMDLGLAVLPADGLTVGFDVLKTEDEEDWKVRVGGEYWFPIDDDGDWRGAGRLGLDTGEFTAGIGLGVGFFELNYAYVQEQVDFLKENHRFSINLNFGERRALEQSSVADDDRDGVPDDQDECPGEPEDFDGYQDTDGCPDYDNDGDGVQDLSDQCPNQAEDFDGVEDTDGCPDHDNDGDGILDADDQCPSEAETFNGFEDADGCPDDEPVYFPLAYINFKFGTAEISGADPIPVLEEVVRIMNERPNIRVEIRGHTDNIGADDANMALSLRRSDAVKSYLVSRGIAGDRLETKGFGEARPIDTNDTDIGRARNRRIEFVVIER